MVHVAHNSGEWEWYTPPEIIESVRKVMGEIDLDPASNDQAQETVQAKVYYTMELDGLSQKWQGRVYLNPPYARNLIGLFVDKAIREADQAIILVNNATETEWGQRLLRKASAVCFPRKRIRFLSPTGVKRTPLQGQMIAAIRIPFDQFWPEFSKYGQSR